MIYSPLFTVTLAQQYQWIQRGHDLEGETAVDVVGMSVSLSGNGNVVAIGAPILGHNGTFDYYDEEFGEHSNKEREGHVHIYGWNGTAWSQLGEDIIGEAVGDRSGSSVSLIRMVM
jgi:hypothetical protein